MKRLFQRSSLIAAAAVLLLQPLSGQAAEPDWSDPQSIDVYAIEIGAFLDIEQDELSRLANIAYQDQDYESAARYFLALVRSDIHDIGSIFDIACCYAYLDQPELAALFLQRAVNGGFESLDRINEEPAFANVRETAVFRETLNRIEAELTQTRATKRFYYATARYDEQDPATIFEVASCYGVRSDARMAAEYLIKAVEAGFRDFAAIENSPDFDTVRGNLEFDELVAGLAELTAEPDLEDEQNPPVLIYNETAVILPCLVHLPRDYDPEQAYPLVIGLHGYGGNLERFASLWYAFDNPQFIYAVPEAAYSVPQPEYAGFSWWHWDLENRPLWDRSVAQANDYALAVTRQIASQYNVGEVYLLGFSQGCALAYSVGINNHEVFTGIIGYSGWLDESAFAQERLAAATDLRLYIAHGTDDASLNVSAGQAARDRFSELGYDVTYREFTGGHTLPQETLQDTAAWIEGRSTAVAPELP